MRVEIKARKAATRPSAGDDGEKAVQVEDPRPGPWRSQAFPQVSIPACENQQVGVIEWIFVLPAWSHHN